MRKKLSIALENSFFGEVARHLWGLATWTYLGSLCVLGWHDWKEERELVHQVTRRSYVSVRDVCRRCDYERHNSQHTEPLPTTETHAIPPSGLYRA